jgi:hypothetical protein
MKPFFNGIIREKNGVKTVINPKNDMTLFRYLLYNSYTVITGSHPDEWMAFSFNMGNLIL